jgi:hypothetical protein
MAFYNRGGYISPVTAMGYGPWQGQSSFTQGQEGFSPFGGDQQGFSAFGQVQSSGMGNKQRPGSYQAFSNLWPGSRSNSNYNRSFFSPQPGVSSAGAVNQTAMQAQMGGPAVDLSQGRDQTADAERLDRIRNLRDQYAQQDPGQTFTLESIMRQEEYLAEENSLRLDEARRGAMFERNNPGVGYPWGEFSSVPNYDEVRPTYWDRQMAELTFGESDRNTGRYGY